MCQIKVWAGCFDEITMERCITTSNINKFNSDANCAGRKTRLNLFVLALKHAVACGPLQKTVLGANEVRTRPLKCHKHRTAYPAEKHVKAHKHIPHQRGVTALVGESCFKRCGL